MPTNKKEYYQKYYNANRERIRERAKKYYQNNKDKLYNIMKKYREKNSEYIKESHKQYYLDNKRRCREINRNNACKRKYGISYQQKQEMILAQNHKCLCCGEALEKLPSNCIHVDHDHITGKIRGILCRRCNAALGFVGENVKIAFKLYEYVRKYCAI